jgi:hypothetical protein
MVVVPAVSFVMGSNVLDQEQPPHEVAIRRPFAAGKFEATFACIAASATFAFEFGWTRGATEVHRWTYALAGVALDLLKAGLPIFGAVAWHESKPARAFACWMVFFVLTALSLWCAYGTTATQLAEKFANQAVASSAQSSRETTLDRLRKQRDAITFTETSAEAVKTAEAAVATATEQAAVERARGGCKDLCRQREAEERTAREALLKALQNHAATVKAADLDGKIAAAEEALNKVDVKAATMQADPQSASVAKAIGADQNLIAALSHAVFAISIELGSGVGFWLVFGHGAPSRRRHETDRIASTVLVPIDRGGAVDLQVIDDKPAEIVERFFLEVRPPEAQRSCPVHGGVVCLQTMVRAPRPQRGLTRYVRSAGTLAEGSGWRDRLVPGC